MTSIFKMSQKQIFDIVLLILPIFRQAMTKQIVNSLLNDLVIIFCDDSELENFVDSLLRDLVMILCDVLDDHEFDHV